ncbi:MAG: hypothetical protein NVSMB26_10150 [Beijerinckiaceae bacterium]
MSDTTQTTTISPILDAFKDVAGRFQVGPAARDYIERGASRAQETLTGIHDNAASFSRSIEAAALRAVETQATVSRNVAQLFYTNAQASLGLVQSLAGSKSLEDAVKVYADYLKNTSETNLAAFRGAAEYVKERVTEGATKAGEDISKAFPRAA